MNKIISTVLLLAFLSLPAAADVVKDTLGIATMTSDNVTELLRGQVPGVRVSAVDNNPNGMLNVNIRGVNSLRTDNQPLWIVDGVMLSPDLNQNLDAFWQLGESSYTSPLSPLAFLSPDNIESIEVLSDISATSIYGSRGANGVIIVNTRSGKSRAKWVEVSTQAGLVTNGSFRSAPGVSHRHNVRFSGGRDRSKFNLSASLRSVSGASPRNGSLFGNMHANYETQTNNTIWFGVNSVLSVGSVSNTTGTAWLGAPSYMLAVRDAALSPGTTAALWLEDYDDDSQDFRGLISAWMRFNILRNLYFKLEGGVDLQGNDRAIWYGPHTDIGAVSETNLNGGAASVLSSSLFSYNGKAILEYNTFIARDHRLQLRACADVRGNSYQFNTMNGFDFVSHQLRAKSLNIRASLPLNHLFRNQYFTFGADALLHYDWKDIVGVNASFRYDRAPKYGRYGSAMYPAAEAYVKYRGFSLSGGYGIAGRRLYIPYERFGQYLSGSWGEVEPGTEPFIDGVDLLRTDEWHVKAAASLLKGRLTLSLCYYDRRTRDGFSMYSFASEPSVTRQGTFYYRMDEPEEVFSRVSGLSNRGLEFSVAAVPVRTGDWKWSLYLNGAYNINRLTSSNVDDYEGRAVGRGIFCSVNVVGEPVSSLYGYKADAVGNYLDITGEGRVTLADKLILGGTIPRLWGGAGTVLSWKDLSLDIALDYAAGFHIANIAALVKDGGKDTAGNTVLSSKYVERGDFCRIGYIGLGYDLPLRLKWLSGLNVSLAVKNPFTFTGYSGWNPDVNSFGINALSNGFDYGSYPLARTVVLGIKAKF